MADLLVVEELSTYLVAQGVAQLPEARPSTALPMVVRQPRRGAPEPRRRDGVWLEEATITLIAATVGPPDLLSDVLEETFVEVIVRARLARTAQLVHRRIRELLVPVGANGGRRQLWTMNDLLVEATYIWRGEQALPAQRDSETYDRVAGYCFECRRKALLGLPYVP